MRGLRWAIIVAVVLSSYVATAFVVSKCMETPQENRSELIASLYLAPLHFIFRPLYPLLRPAGLLEGEYWVLPSKVGFACGILIYSAMAFMLGAITDLRR